MSRVGLGTHVDHLEALARAALAVAEDLRNGLAAGADSKPVGAGGEPAVKPDLITAAEVAEALRIDVRTLRRKRKLGKAPKALRGKGPLRWHRSDVDRWIEEGRS